MELREKIAETIWDVRNPANSGFKGFREIPEYSRTPYYQQADAILALPEIKAGLKLLWVEQQLGEYDLSSELAPKA